jgi:hypothetical protein
MRRVMYLRQVRDCLGPAPALLAAAVAVCHVAAGNMSLLAAQAPAAVASPQESGVAAERAALATIVRLIIAARERPTLDADALRDIETTATTMNGWWQAGRGVREAPVSESLPRVASALERAIGLQQNAALRAIAADLAAKRDDCLSRPERMFNRFPISVRTLRNGSEQSGLKVRYIERFFWELLSQVPSLAGEWREFATATQIVNEQLPPGDYVIVARAPTGQLLGEPTPISVGRGRPTTFDLILP